MCIFAQNRFQKCEMIAKTERNMNHILHNKLEALKKLCRHYKKKSLYAFGSINTLRFTEKSDIDLLIEFEPDICDPLY